MSKGYTLIELLITMTIISLMAIMGIIAFQGYGRGTIFSQTSSEVEGAISQVGLLAKNPEQDAKSYCLIAGNNKITLYKGLDPECSKRLVKNEINLTNNIVITDGPENVAYHFLSCQILADTCYLKSEVDSLGLLNIKEKSFIFRITDGNNKNDFFFNINPFLVEVEQKG